MGLIIQRGSLVQIIKTFVALTSLTTCVMLFQNCGSYQSAETSSATQIADPVTGELVANLAHGISLYDQSCIGCHGALVGSTVLLRDASQISFATVNEPQMSAFSSTLSQYDIDSLALALNQGGVVVVVPPEGRAEFLCQPGVASKTPLLKLTNREYQSSINAILDGFSTSLKSDAEIVQLFSMVPTDIVVEDRDTYKEQAKLITEPGTASHFNIAYRASELVALSSTQILGNYPNTGGCLALADITSNCFRQFITELATRAFRRPIPSGEVNTLVTSFWDAGASRIEKIQMGIAGITQSPDFLYKAFDRGAAIPNTSNTLNLTAHELAAKVSFLLTGGPPDSQLRSLADSGAILNASILDQQVERLFGTAEARQAVSRLFKESYGYDYHSDLNYSSNFRAGLNTSGLREGMDYELDQYFPHLVLDNSATFDELMTSRWSSINSPALAAVYGTNTGSNQTLPANRSGFLNRASMLTKRSGSKASPIKRGLSVLEHVLCKEVGEPPPSAPTTLPTIGNEVLTTRETTFRSTEVQGSSCIGCHAPMNNLGYAFEGFDSLGRSRVTEAIYGANDVVQEYLGIDTVMSTSELSSTAQDFDSSLELVHGIGQSDVAMMCFVRHLKRFETRSLPQSTDFCQMNEVLNVMYGVNSAQGSVKDAFKNLIGSDNFKKWSY